MRHDERGSLASIGARRERLFETSRGLFGAKSEPRLEARYTSALSWQSSMNFASGYAMSTREILRALDDAGVYVDYRYECGAGTPVLQDEPPATNDPLLDRIRARRSPRRPDMAVTYAPGDVFRRNRGRRRIGFTMIEVDGFPAGWVRQANALDEIWTPTEFNRAALLGCGVKRPVHLIPLGVDPSRFHPAVRRIPNPRGEYVFLTSLAWGERKNPELLLRTFNATFRRDEPVLLVCKINHRDPGVHVPNAIRALGLEERGGRIYFVYNRELPHHQLASFYRSADCFVSTSRGEGWGLPLFEAMACGLPAIATDWGGHSAFLDPADTYPLRVRSLIPALSLCPYYGGFRWADADAEHLAFLLRHVYEHQDEARERGLHASARVRATLTWKHTAQKIINRISET